MWLRNVKVVDVLSGSCSDSSVQVEGGVITKIVADSEPGYEAHQSCDVDLGGGYLLPGLISVHTHLSVTYPFSATNAAEDSGVTVLRALARAVEALDAGVTTVRCVHEQNRADLVLRQASRDGWVSVPTIVGAGRAISTSGGHGHGMATVYADGADAFLHAAREELGAGADHVKIFLTGGIADVHESLGGQMTLAEIEASVRAAADHGTYVVAHAGSSASIREGLSAGVRSFEHAYELDEETARMMAEAQVFLTPTLCVTRCPEWMADHQFTREQIARAVEVGPGHLDSIRRAVRAGVRLVSGTDYPPGAPIEDTVVAVREIEFMVEAGLSPVLALQSATSTAAALIGRADRTGRIAEGYDADLICVGQDPTINVGALRNLSFVMHQGKVIRAAPAA